MSWFSNLILLDRFSRRFFTTFFENIILLRGAAKNHAHAGLILNLSALDWYHRGINLSTWFCQTAAMARFLVSSFSVMLTQLFCSNNWSIISLIERFVDAAHQKRTLHSLQHSVVDIVQTFSNPRPWNDIWWPHPQCTQIWDRCFVETVQLRSLLCTRWTEHWFHLNPFAKVLVLKASHQELGRYSSYLQTLTVN